jgi:methionyl-tRNA synthetase
MPGALTDDDRALQTAAEGLLAAVRGDMEEFAIHRMLEDIWRVVSDANRYVDAQAPWALRKTDPERMATVLYVLADVIRQLAIFVQPVVPGSAAKMLDQLAVAADFRDFAALSHALAPDTELPAPTAVFPRIVEDAA